MKVFLWLFVRYFLIVFRVTIITIQHKPAVTAFGIVKRAIVTF